MQAKAGSLLAENEINNNPNLLPDAKLEVVFIGVYFTLFGDSHHVATL